MHFPLFRSGIEVPTRGKSAGTDIWQHISKIQSGIYPFVTNTLGWIGWWCGSGEFRQLISVTGNLPVTTHCWTENKLADISSSLRQSELIQKDYSQSKLIIKSTDPKDNVIKTSAKSQDESQDTSEITWCLITIRWNPSTEIYLKVLEAFKSANHQTIMQAIANWNTWRKWEFPSHMTIYGYKYRLIWTEIQSWKVSLSASGPKGWG